MVAATVYDITDTACALPGSLLFDTNTCLDLFYPAFSLPGSTRRAISAHSYIYARCLAEGVRILRSSFSFPEMAHVIEKDIVDTYATNIQRSLRTKQSRRMPNLRRDVVSKVGRAWRDLEAASEPLDGLLADDDLAKRALVRYGTQALDGYDLFVVEQVLASADKSIVSDDSDYVSVPGLKLYTANRDAIDRARQTGRLR